MTPPPPPRRAVNLTDLVSGLAVAGLCAAVAVRSYGYGLGGFARMGPGFYPFAVAVAGIAAGAAIAIRAVLVPGGAEATIRWRQLLFVCAAFVVFGLLIEPGGLVAAIVAATVLGSFADPGARLGESVLLGLGLSAGVWLIFVRLLGLAIGVLPEGW